jgi:hypothetical protein
MNREETLAQLLRPIEWSWSSSVRARQNMVVERRKAVANAYPFLDTSERERADLWLKKEKHSDLWD